MTNDNTVNNPKMDFPTIRARPRTFFGAPICANLKTLDSDIAILGTPFDQGTFARPGARFGPDSIRDANIYSYTCYHLNETEAAPGFFDIDSGQELLKGITIADCGDISVIPSEVLNNFAKLTKSVETIVEMGAFPVVVGGDHSITFPIVRGLSKYSTLDIVHFDAHMDYTHETEGVLYTQPHQEVS